MSRIPLCLRTVLFSILFALGPTIVAADTVTRFHNDYPFTLDQTFKPVDAEQVAVDPAALNNAIKDYEIASTGFLARRKFEVTDNGDYLRFVLRWDEYDSSDTTLDQRFKTDQAACFEKGDTLRCFVLISFRKETMPHRDISQKGFVDQQAEYVFSRRPDGSLRGFAQCGPSRCPGVTWQ